MGLDKATQGAKDALLKEIKGRSIEADDLDDEVCGLLAGPITNIQTYN